MTDQMVLIETEPSWRMDASTREAGRRGVARARRALREARSRAIEAPDRSPADPDDRGDLVASAA